MQTTSLEQTSNEIIVDNDVLILALQIKRWQNEGNCEEIIKKDLNKMCGLGWTTETLITTAYKLLEICTIDQLNSFLMSRDDKPQHLLKWTATLETIKNVADAEHIERS